VGRQFVRTAITIIILTPARPMGSTGLTTLWVASLWEPDRGTTGDIQLGSGDVAGAGKAGVAKDGDVKDGVTKVGVAATVEAVGVGATKAGALWDVETQAAVNFTEAEAANSTVVAEVAFTVGVALAAGTADSMVAEAAKERSR